MSSVDTHITSDSTVNDIVRLYPATIPVFNEFGIDSCCGGAAALRVAAERDGADLSALLARLNAVIEKS
ncbi:MAG TPA: DUF542 domain-containing protein [Longimicrobiales bacterium]|nr:DUF542 domain-containing protein [Longimicrobiales bacterium]